MAALFQLVIMDDTDQGMHRGCPHMAGIIIDTLYLKDFFHAAKLGKLIQIP